MKRLVMMIVVGLVLAACGSGDGKWVDHAYTAVGDDTDPDKLVKTTVFQPSDDLNVVVVLGSHNRDLAAMAVFTDPTGRSIPTDVLELDKTVGPVTFGLDFEQSGEQNWTAGDWRVDVYVGEPQKNVDFVPTDNNFQTGIKFRVEAPAQAG